MQWNQKKKIKRPSNKNSAPSAWRKPGALACGVVEVFSYLFDGKPSDRTWLLITIHLLVYVDVAIFPSNYTAVCAVYEQRSGVNAYVMSHAHFYRSVVWTARASCDGGVSVMPIYLCVCVGICIMRSYIISYVINIKSWEYARCTRYRARLGGGGGALKHDNI